MKILYFGAEWCQPCKQVKPILENLQNIYPEIDFVYYDVNDNEEDFVKNDVRSFPTIIFIEINKQTRLQGIQSEHSIKQVLKEF